MFSVGQVHKFLELCKSHCAMEKVKCNKSYDVHDLSQPLNSDCFTAARTEQRCATGEWLANREWWLVNGDEVSR